MARLPQGVRKRKDGVLEKRITIDGKRYSLYASNTKDLYNKESELREQVKNGSYLQNKNITLEKYFDEWIKRKSKEVKSNTIFIYKTMFNTHIRNTLGNKKISQLEKREIIIFRDALSENITPSTCNYIIGLLKQLLYDAVSDEIITRNPAQTIKSLKAQKTATKTIHRALTIQEQKLFMQELKKQDSYYYNFFAFCLLTGMRYGEVTALTWNDINYEKNIIHVNKTMTKDENGKMILGDSTKSKAGERDIPINDSIKMILKSARGISDIIPFTTTRVFNTPYGHVIQNTNINKEIKRIVNILSDAGHDIKPFTVHALRDTFATRYIEQGGSPQTLKTILGHSSLSMTMDLYAQVLPNTKQDEMNKIIIAI